MIRTGARPGLAAAARRLAAAPRAARPPAPGARAPSSRRFHKSALRIFGSVRGIAPVGGAPRARGMCSEAPVEREAMEYDVLIVGGGPAGLSAAIRMKQLALEGGQELSVCVVEKGAEVGSHILSGNVFEPHALDELIPDWRDKGAPLQTEAKEDNFLFLTSDTSSFKIPNFLLPKVLHNEGNYIISLGELCRWLGTQAEELGVEVYPGFAADEVIYTEGGAVTGIVLKDVGIGKDGKPKDVFEMGMELRARQTILAEGCRGSCSEMVMDKYKLREGKDVQTYGIGIKEVWEVDPAKFKSGLIQHSVGWPLDSSTYGGSFLYHMEDNKVLMGMVVGLDYKNPYLNPYQEFQRWKTHPAIKTFLEGGTCISYGARALNEGGFQAIPKLTFPGGALVGCSAGFVNVPKIKGSHTAMKSGMLAAEAVFEALTDQSEQFVGEGEEVASFKAFEPSSYQAKIEGSWVWSELKSVRNVHPAFHNGLYLGLLYSGLTLKVFRGLEPWTFSNTSKGDHTTTGKKADHEPIEYPKPDGKLTFDILSNLQRSGVNHNHDQPAHLRVKDELADWPKNISFQEYGAPETRFCPAKVYEFVEDEATGEPKLVINAQNCVHCKTCDIKTPGNYIKWTVPEGGGGPAYVGM
mmetsp:Transcript_67950/g.167828  ORF Transcript_67950/g.167828 Transcript_67950/m.167828 type:complete len:636 (+) Transcript_67950:212-2119(+)|eukprot:CAMPEP_0206233716 /NCGR_PEP_ID=MMETSP0047_2-20121206/12173_1 /ASSEMBLY_ACC=CAM_ASM_000192 /TAXON_ID=195065 /ORGANISM="Chroomonas mesostigmatica_cf, Strain CCMP1168" /LENGTH=635 /DNA_ID=CAMNT_0053657689 /DNA_START=173 /DNA_END=2080 /DNA_ORIENTATION=+